ncbi:hypothetical protein [Chitiniphilus shinanonensis]|uniref:hypothetical protein n=1 Tax=Chitiniphilus shinanonensis TaxID=553088 RepID=UPI00333E71E2
MIKLLIKIQVFVFFVFLAMLLVLFDSFFIDSTVLCCMVLLGGALTILVALRVLCLICKKRSFRGGNFWVDFFSIGVAIVTISIFFYSLGEIKARGRDISLYAAKCFLDKNCDDAKMIGFTKEGESTFSATYGVLTVINRVERQENGCFRIYSLHVDGVINDIVCRDGSGRLAVQDLGVGQVGDKPRYHAP